MRHKWLAAAALLGGTALAAQAQQPMPRNGPYIFGVLPYQVPARLGKTFTPIAADFSRALDALNHDVREEALLAGLIGTFFCAAVSLIASQVLAGRLHHIVEAARRIRSGDLSARAGLGDGDEIGELGIAFDQMVESLASTQRELQQHQSGLEELVQQRTEELRSAQASLVERERLSVLGKLTASVSHELRNPLGTIAASICLIRREIGALSSAAQRAVNRVERSIERSVRIIEDLKDYSSDLAPRQSCFELDGLVALLVQDLETDAVHIEMDLASNLWLRADQELFGKALTHVLRNAAQASSQAGDARSGQRVRVRCALETDHVVIEVSDDAGGIPEAELSRVFAPLYSTRSFGAGLGLPIARRLIEQIGGTLAIESRKVRGPRYGWNFPPRHGPDPTQRRAILGAL